MCKLFLKISDEYFSFSYYSGTPAFRAFERGQETAPHWLMRGITVAPWWLKLTQVGFCNLLRSWGEMP